ncbi:hypothetical protein [Accumulibacter sp.]|uniref:hypothetical protein n=1 Tax=Accumulibacter sp. TaxID=2053492 RepID=UPI00338EC9BE
MSEPVARFSDALWVALGVLGMGLVVAALVQVFVGLAPLRKLHAALGKVRSGETPRLNGDFPAEIMPLVEELNTVLAQNAEVVERARTQAGNLAHALKTPLSYTGQRGRCRQQACEPGARGTRPPRPGAGLHRTSTSGLPPCPRTSRRHQPHARCPHPAAASHRRPAANHAAYPRRAPA